MLTEDHKTAALNAANGWVDQARPLIEAYLKLDKTELGTAAFNAERGEKRLLAQTYRSAQRHIDTAMEALDRDIGLIRSDAIADAMPVIRDATPEQQDDECDLYEALKANVITAEAAYAFVADDIAGTALRR